MGERPVRVRFAPSPTGALHLGGALTAVANRRFADEHGGTLVLRIDDTDAARVDPAAEASILADLAWLGVGWDEGPIRQSERGERYRAAAGRLLAADAAYLEDGAVRFRGERDPTLLRPDGSATYQLASVVDDVELAISHVIRGLDHLPNRPLHEALARALGAEPPAYLHHGLILGPDGRKLSKRHGDASVADLREAGLPAEAVRAYLDELGLPQGDVRLDRARFERLAIEAIGALADEELAGRAGAPVELAPALRGARTLVEARAMAEGILVRPAPVAPDERGALTLRRFVELRDPLPDRLDRDSAHAVVRELKAVGGDLRALRRALTGAERGPELWAVVLALPREEALHRAADALGA
ncbi:MAG: glutamate--tRNA ligase family protein [Thermoleophilia bacterium]